MLKTSVYWPRVRFGGLIALGLVLWFQQPRAYSQQTFWGNHRPLIDGDDGHANNPSCAPSNQLYKCQYHGNLYGHWNDNGSNVPDATHNLDGVNRANSVKNQPKIGVVMIGMSHLTKEMCTNQPPNHQIPPINDALCSNNHNYDWSFIYKATHNSQVNNSKIVFADCAQLGGVAGYWVNDTIIPPNQTKNLWANCMDILTGLGLAASQVQVVMFKEADSGEPGAPNPPLVELPTSGFAGCQYSNADACNLLGFMGTIARQVKLHFSNAQQMFVHSRGYAGYADPGESPLNPEPFAYEQGFSIKWLIQGQVDDVNTPGITHLTVEGPLDYNANEAPWIDWGTYIWASNTTIPCLLCPMPSPSFTRTPVTWRQDVSYHNNQQQMCPPNDPTKECDYQATTLNQNSQVVPDNNHPSLCGRDKVSNLMMYFYCHSPYTVPWFTANGSACTNVPAPNNQCQFGQGSDLP